MKRPPAILVALVLALAIAAAPSPRTAAQAKGGPVVLAVEDLALHFLTAEGRAQAFLEANTVVILGLFTGEASKEVEEGSVLVLGPSRDCRSDAGLSGLSAREREAVASTRFHATLLPNDTLPHDRLQAGDQVFLACRRVGRAGEGGKGLARFAGTCRTALVMRGKEQVHVDIGLLGELEGR